MRQPLLVPSLARRAVAEGLGTMLLLAAVVGSGIMGERLAGGNGALTLLANTLATGAVLVVLIAALGPLSGAHLNPVVTLALAWRRYVPTRIVPAYVTAQVAGALAGVVVAHGMFDLAPFAIGQHARSGPSQMWSELVATFGLVFAVLACARHRSTHAPFVIAAYVTAAYWFTASTSFANPAVTLARAATDTFSGIRPADVPGFVLAQALGAAAASALAGWLHAEAADSGTSGAARRVRGSAS